MRQHTFIFSRPVKIVAATQNLELRSFPADAQHSRVRAPDPRGSTLVDLRLLANGPPLRSVRGDDHFDAKVDVLGEYIDHHVKEEQEEMFPKAKKAKVGMADLGAQIAARKEVLHAS